ncbi:RNA-binding protein [Quillaja saponaria]|nr:RNA-binding protein [Quillaja saponaria]
MARAGFPGYLSSEALPLASHHIASSTDFRSIASDYPQKDINTSQPGAYGLVDIASIGVCQQPVIGGVTSGAHLKGYPSLDLEDSDVLSRKRDIQQGVPDISNDRPISTKNMDGLSVPAAESNILFVDGLPTDCTRREVGHLFRPFIGYKDIRVVHKEPRHSGDKAMVLCFVEFVDPKCAHTALEALEGYKFDDKKSDSRSLKIQFAHFPFRLTSDHDETTH